MMTNATTMTEPRPNHFYGIARELQDNTYRFNPKVSYTVPNQYLNYETNPDGIANIPKNISLTNKTTDASTMTDYSYST